MTWAAERRLSRKRSGTATHIIWPSRLLINTTAHKKVYDMKWVWYAPMLERQSPYSKKHTPSGEYGWRSGILKNNGALARQEQIYCVTGSLYALHGKTALRKFSLDILWKMRPYIDKSWWCCFFKLQIAMMGSRHHDSVEKYYTTSPGSPSAGLGKLELCF